LGDGGREKEKEKEREREVDSPGKKAKKSVMFNKSRFAN